MGRWVDPSPRAAERIQIGTTCECTATAGQMYYKATRESEPVQDITIVTHPCTFPALDVTARPGCHSSDPRNAVLMNTCNSLSSLVLRWLASAFPKAKIIGRNGAVSSTGSSYMVRLEKTASSKHDSSLIGKIVSHVRQKCSLGNRASHLNAPSVSPPPPPPFPPHLPQEHFLGSNLDSDVDLVFVEYAINNAQHGQARFTEDVGHDHEVKLNDEFSMG